jgi:hypothetical protein
VRINDVTQQIYARRLAHLNAKNRQISLGDPTAGAANVL